MSHQSLRLINKANVSTFVKDNYFAIYQAVIEAYLLLGRKQAVNPPSSLIWYDEYERKRVIALPAYIGAHIKRPGIKWIASSPKNISRNMERASAVLILNDYETGYPVAIIEASIISAVRTVLSAIAALACLNNTRFIGKLAIIGCGYISKNFLSAATVLGWKISSINIYDTCKDRVDDFISQHPATRFNSCLNAEQAIAESDVVLLATSATEAYINDTSCLKQQIILNLSLRDLDPEFIKASINIVDNIEHLLTSNTSVSVAIKKFHDDNLVHGTITDLLNGDMNINQQMPCIFSPMGLGVLDVIIGDLILKNSINLNIGQSIDNFFGA